MKLEAVIPILVCLQTLIMLGGIPWAMSVYARLAKLEVSIAAIVPAKDVATRVDLDELETKLDTLRDKQATDGEDARGRLAPLERDVQRLLGK